eukprot:5740321-Alexandrium_andersonii.AAC.1
MDDHAAGTGDHVTIATVCLHFELQPSEGLGADAGDALQQTAAAAVELNDQASGPGRGHTDEAGAPEDDGRPGQGGEVAHEGGGRRGRGHGDHRYHRIKPETPEKGLDGAAHADAGVDRARDRGA